MINELGNSKRLLKVLEVGDFWKKRTYPLIRIQGKWVAKAGITPNAYVEISNPRPGILVLQVKR